MNNAIEGIVFLGLIVFGFYFLFSNDWLEYECDEYMTGNKIEHV